MLFKQHILDGIAAGRITQAFRRWRRPSVKQGGTLRTAVGVLSILSVTEIAQNDLKPGDAKKAGFASLEALRADIHSQRAGTLYRVRFKLAGADPRIALRNKAAISAQDRADLERRVQRLDKASRTGPWTLRVLALIRDNPATRATELANAMGAETLAFKRNVRKLKELGLTESLGTGYRLSPRGVAFLAGYSQTTKRAQG